MVIFGLFFVLWMIVHSVTAASGTKTWFRSTFGERAYAGLYRGLYNLVSLLTFLPVYYLLKTQIPQRLLWEIPYPWRWLTIGVQLLALIGLGVSLWQTDVWSFIGLRQAARFINGESQPEVEPRFVNSGTYRWMRHPLYFFSMLFLWLNPVMMLDSFVFIVLATLYFWIGSVYEERRLERLFGVDYQAYQMRVPRMIPYRWPQGDILA